MEQEQAERPPLDAGTTAELAQRAQDVFDEAMDRLRDGDWAGYGEAIDQLGALLDQLASTTQ